jgi:nudix-type nucleoside diphosphatase (YffH/AdpP family)
MDLFVYGTLKSHALMAAVAGPGPMNPVEGRLDGYAVYPVAGNVVPFIAPCADGQAMGIVWQGLTAEQMARLDAYEGAFGYSFGPVEVQVPGGTCIAQCYLPPDDMAPGTGTWSLAEWEAGHLTPAVLAANELFSLDPLPSHARLRAMWPMIEARAWSKFRAAVAPASRRYDAAMDDFDVVSAQPPSGRFFRFQSVDVKHKLFTGGTSDLLAREAFIGVDAAILLPYDPVRDRILLVEQARLGPKMRHDPNPWMLEPIAGMIDAREAPQDAALREAHEEAALQISTLAFAGSFYASPGSTTDYFYTYVGLCDLPRDDSYLGGLPDEGEDLRLHPIGFDAAMRLADSGEIAVGPALFLLYWLRHHRDRLRATVT